MDRFDRFTDRARRALTDAQAEAARFDQKYIGPEHILLGVIAVDDDAGAQILVNLGVELPKVRRAVEFLIDAGQRPVVGEVGLTPAAKHVIELAIDEARRMEHRYLGTEHLLLGILRQGDSVAAGVLESVGVNLGAARREVLRLAPMGSAAANEIPIRRSDPTIAPDSSGLNEFVIVRWVPDGLQDVGELIVDAQAHGFAGRSSAYFSGSAILEFAGRLGKQPLPAEPLEIRSGHLRPGSDELDEHVGIAVATVGNLGQVGLVIHLAEVWPKRPETRSEVRLELLATYERLSRFGRDLGRLVRGEQAAAQLDGEVLRT